jgi:hypothetical protein
MVNVTEFGNQGSKVFASGLGIPAGTMPASVDRRNAIRKVFLRHSTEF